MMVHAGQWWLWILLNDWKGSLNMVNDDGSWTVNDGKCWLVMLDASSWSLVMLSDGSWSPLTIISDHDYHGSWWFSRLMMANFMVDTCETQGPPIRSPHPHQGLGDRRVSGAAPKDPAPQPCGDGGVPGGWREMKLLGSASSQKSPRTQPGIID